MSDDELARCYQCDWPLRRGQAWVLVVGTCEDCGNEHPIGVVHLDICASDMANREPRAITQKRRAGAGGLN